ncbi:VWA domain-containing protein [Alkalihalobacillus sp. 1P02AB]|uniref:VWA domain-containing protein n=1 Tax=Alkalihalobacillus sp. 1P02AB TaxID=3132260 RepID=UPI0039A46F1B
MSFEFSQPVYFLLFLLVIPALLFFLWPLKEKKKGETKLIVGIRSLVFALIILALADPSLVLTSKVIDTVFVLDRSDSVGERELEMERFIVDAVNGKKEEDTFSIVSFANEAVVERLPGTQTPFTLNEKLAAGQTNMEAGLQVALSLFPERTGRIVLISDGLETKGDATLVTNIAKQQGVTVDTYLIDQEEKMDVAIRDLSVSQQVYSGEKANITFDVTSSTDIEGDLRIRLNRDVIIDETLSLKEGMNTFQYAYLASEPGLNLISVEINATGDQISENNHLMATSQVMGEPKVLIVEGEVGAAENLVQALTLTGFQYERMSVESFPSNLNHLLNYEAVIFANVSAVSLSEEKMELMETAVKQFGVGFMMTGGEQSFGLGGYFKTPIEDILPVEMEVKGEEELPSLGIIFVIDRSGSMDGYRLQLAKEAAARSVELLREQDTVGVIAFDDTPWQIVETGPIEDVQEVADQIASITPGGGTEIFGALDFAYPQLLEEELQRKHIILLTDGESYSGGDYQTLIEGGLEESVTLSTVAISSGANHQLLEELAEYGSGRFYSVYDESTIPSILSRETIMMTRTYIEDHPFYPTVVRDSEWTPLWSNGIAEMNAYIATTNKPRAELILESEKGDPVLSRWQYGLGKTIAWTSDLQGQWAGNWASWQEWPTFLNQLVTWMLPSAQTESFHVKQTQHGSTTKLELTTESEIASLLDAQLVNESGQQVESQFRMVAPGNYELSFEADAGIHYLQLTDQLEESTSIYQTSLSVPYSAEYESKEADEAFLAELASNGGGELLLEPEQVFRPLENPKQEREAVGHWLILLALALFFSEIVIRRFGLPRLKGMKRRQATEKAAPKSTFSSLNQRAKREAKAKTALQEKTTMDQKRDTSKQMKARKESVKEKPTELAKQDMMKRLLEAKKNKKR